MIPHSYFENLYRAERSRWDHWTDFCWWLEENVIPGIEQFLDILPPPCDHQFDLECPECGEWIYL